MPCRMSNSNCKKELNRRLQPKALIKTLKEYREEFGKEFGLSDLLKTEEIECLHCISTAVLDIAEVLKDKTKLKDPGEDRREIMNALDNISDSIAEIHFQLYGYVLDCEAAEYGRL